MWTIVGLLVLLWLLGFIGNFGVPRTLDGAASDVRGGGVVWVIGLADKSLERVARSRRTETWRATSGWSTTVSCTATDTRGNSGTAAFTVTVADTTAPVVTVPANATLEATGSSGAIFTYSATASDLVDGNVAVSCTPASGVLEGWPVQSSAVACAARSARIVAGDWRFEHYQLERLRQRQLAVRGCRTPARARLSNRSESFKVT